MFITPTPLALYANYPNLLSSQCHILIEVEQLVEQIIYRYGLKKYINASSKNELIFPELFYHQLLCSLYRYLSAYQLNYSYSEHYDALLYACCQVGIIYNDINSGLSYVFPADIYQMYVLVEHIALYSKTIEFSRKLGDRAQRQKENCQRITTFAQAMQQKYARVLVCRVDLGYLHDYQHLVSMDMVIQHLQLLLKQMSYRLGLFANMKGYIWAIEQGVHKGYHTHLMVYFDGRCHQQGWYMSDQVGMLWKTITGLYGSYFNCHANKQRYIEMGIYGLDMIYRDDMKACANAVHVASYLAREDKTDQFLRCKPRRAKAIGMSLLA